MRPLKAIESLTITVLADDAAGNGDLRAEHGLSLWIEGDCCRVLFDTGQGGALRENARALGLNFSEIDTVVLSHGHYDHSGGIQIALESCAKADFYLHPDALRTRYGLSEAGGVRSIGIPLAAGNAIRQRSESLRWTRTVTRLHPFAFVTGEIPRAKASNGREGRFFVDAECTTPDLFPDDQALVIETTRGAVVVLGCSHAGVENTLSCALRLTKLGRLRAVVGGMHLDDAPDETVAGVADFIEALCPDVICPIHCSGARARNYFHDRFPRAFVEGHVGTILHFSGDA